MNAFADIRAFMAEHDRLRQRWVLLPYTMIGSQSMANFNEPAVVKFNEDLLRAVNHLLPFQQARRDAVMEADMPESVLKIIMRKDVCVTKKIHRLQLKMDRRRKGLQYRVGSRRLKNLYPVGYY